MQATDSLPELPALQTAARAHAGLRLLILHGSRARGDAHLHSDWDFAYLAAPGLDPGALHADLTLALGSDNVDLAPLEAAGGLLRYRAARDAVVVFESEPGVFYKFWFQAVSFWCDAEPVLRPHFKAILAELDQ